MLLTVLDSAGVSQKVITRAQESALDHSGIIVATAVAQQVLAANTLRSGFIIQNRGSNPMYVNDLGVATVGAGSFAIAPGNFFPPDNYPLKTGAISILGTINDIFVVREW